jgi:SOS-response transcriptional repressor LexA
MAYIKDIRRENMRALAESMGGITAMARQLGKSQSQISHLIGPHPIKNIGDKIAAEIEEIFHKPRGWMDKQHGLLSDLTATYTLDTSVNQRYLLPLISWSQIWLWPKMTDAERIKECSQWIPSTSPFSKQAYALRLEQHNLEKSSGISFPCGTIILLEPEKPASHGCFIIVSNSDQELAFKQLIVDNKRHYLKCLLPDTEQTLEPCKSLTVHGVVRQMLVEFD